MIEDRARELAEEAGLDYEAMSPWLQRRYQERAEQLDRHRRGAFGP